MLIGCYPTCKGLCRSNNKFYLKDRKGLNFRIIPNKLQGTTDIYNAKTLSIEYDDLNIDYARIDILDENISEINTIIKNVKDGKKFTRF